ncbi:alpha/beta hydrolase family protein [Actinomadura macrotermitis]|uniref:Poly(ethylene terephthalate) hydrolase n=1 Tax=Actinomadura macrotermitis TaxID=2585200 RepID=A0A7K0C0L9_9ACTN|nr:Poly(ethylene terephthalate) hydrolase [Actinomadura macrotermitis]
MPRTTLRTLAAAVLAAGAVGVLPTAPAHAAGFERGPAPTEASVTAAKGPFAIDRIEVPAGSGTGFNSGTIYYPTSTAEGTFGAVAISPGFVSPKSWIDWYGPRLASQGFVVMTLETFSYFDAPDGRADQLLAALDYLTAKSKVKDRIDPNRLAAMGHSMGGGGALSAAVKRPSLKAVVPLAPWYVGGGLEQSTVPTMIFGADNDFIAPVASNARPFYQSLTKVPEKAYLELENAGHVGSFNSPNTTIAKYAISWLKRFVDDDTRYSQFLCPAPKFPSSTIQEYRDTCPS